MIKKYKNLKKYKNFYEYKALFNMALERGVLIEEKKADGSIQIYQFDDFHPGNKYLMLSVDTGEPLILKGNLANFKFTTALDAGIDRDKLFIPEPYFFGWAYFMGKRYEI